MLFLNYMLSDWLLRKFFIYINMGSSTFFSSFNFFLLILKYFNWVEEEEEIV